MEQYCFFTNVFKNKKTPSNIDGVFMLLTNQKTINYEKLI